MYDLAVYEQMTSIDRTLRAIAERDASHARAAREARAARRTAEAGVRSTGASPARLAGRFLVTFGGLVRPRGGRSANRGKPRADLPLSI